MSFYHTNSEICIGDIVDICEIENNNIDLNKTLSKFVRADIATSNDLSFFTSSKYLVETDAEFLITNNKLSNYLSSKKNQ